MNDAHTLAVHRFLLRAALAMGNIFAWVLLFHALYFSGETTAGALFVTIVAYAFVQLVVFFLTPLAAANLPHGTARSMLCAVLAQAAAFLWLGASSLGVFGVGAINLWWGITGFVILSGIYRAFYWVPYATTSATLPSGWTPRTRFFLELFLALIPISAGLLITQYESGAWLALVSAAALAFLAVIPLIRVTDTYERFDWGYEETISTLFSRAHRTVLSRSFQEGVQGAALLFIWPLTVFVLLDWSYFLLGTIISMTLILTLFARKSFRNLLRRINLERSHRAVAALAATSWVLRITIVSPISVVIADTLYHLGLPSKRYGVDPVAYEQAADNAHYIDEYTALKEMGGTLGRIALCTILGALLFFVSPIAALASALIVAAATSIIAIYEAAESRDVI